MRQHTREDGRPLHQARVTSVVSSVLTRNTVGSAMARLGDTKVVAGVTVQIGNPCATRPNCGTITLESLHTSPLCGKNFGVRNNNTNANTTNARTIQDVQATESYLKRILQSSNIIDLEDLCIEPGISAWKLCIYIEVLNHDGNLIDASLLAALAALANVQLPSVVHNKNTDDDDDGNNRSNRSATQIQILPHSKDQPFLKLHSIPIPLSIGVFYADTNDTTITEKEEETSFLLVDPNAMEEQACHGIIHVVVDSQTEQIYSCQTIGAFHSSPEQLAASIQMALGRAQEMKPLIQSCNNQMNHNPTN